MKNKENIVLTIIFTYILVTQSINIAVFELRNIRSLEYILSVIMIAILIISFIILQVKKQKLNMIKLVGIIPLCFLFSYHTLKNIKVKNSVGGLLLGLSAFSYVVYIVLLISRKNKKIA